MRFSGSVGRCCAEKINEANMKMSKVLRVLSTAESAGSILLALDMGSSANPVNAIAIAI
jgi:hypothetical protein